MHTFPRYLCLSSTSRDAVTVQASLSGTYQYELVDAATSEHVVEARVSIEQCSKGMTARVELADSVNTITFASRGDNAARLSVFIESLANDIDLPENFLRVDEHLSVGDLESTLRDAIREKRGTFYLPVDGLEDLALLIRPSAFDPKRVSFKFELEGNYLTLPVLMPADRNAAYDLISGCVKELIANYRVAA